MMVVELLASHTYVPSKFLFRKKNTTYWLSDLLYYFKISRPFFRHAQILVYFCRWVASGKRTIRQPGRNNQKVTTFFFCTDFTLFSFLFQRCCQWFQPGVRTDVPSRCLGKNVATFWLFFPDRGTVRLWPATRWEKKTMFEHAFVKNCLLFLQVGSCTLTAATFWVD